jgi:hypothetical protein
LKAMKTITCTAHKVYLPGQSPAGTNFGNPEKRITMRCKFFDEIASLPPASGGLSPLTVWRRSDQQDDNSNKGNSARCTNPFRCRLRRVLRCGSDWRSKPKH